MEDMGEEYLVELINRCTVQVGSRGVTGRYKTIRLHDLMRDLCMSKAREENFLDIIAENSVVLSPNHGKLRRLAIHFACERYASSWHSSPLLRTHLIFNPEWDVSDLHMKFIFQDFKLLSVLDMGGVNFNKERLPKEIGKLLHLRYLGLKDTCARMIPKTSIGNLQSLQTLDLRVRNIDIIILNVIWKIVQLRHLYLNYWCNSSHLRMDTLKNLQTLWCIKAGSWVEGLANLSNLQKLGIKKLLRIQVELVLNSISGRSEGPLRSLYLGVADQTFPDLEPLSHCHHLLKLHLEGRILNLPQWPPKLIELTLTYSRLQEDPMASLQNLPNLTVFRLEDVSYEGKEMVCSAKGFPQLQYLHLIKLEELEKWIVKKGAMPCLKHLKISECNKLRMVLEGLMLLPTLKELDISDMPTNFKDRVRKGGEDCYNVQHIASIFY